MDVQAPPYQLEETIPLTGRKIGGAESSAIGRPHGRVYLAPARLGVQCIGTRREQDVLEQCLGERIQHDHVRDPQGLQRQDGLRRQRTIGFLRGDGGGVCLVQVLECDWV
jgi:hypothetical protein